MVDSETVGCRSRARSRVPARGKRVKSTGKKGEAIARTKLSLVNREIRGWTNLMLVPDS